MRKNTEKVLEAWLIRKPLRACAAIWTDGTHIYSYSTCILAGGRQGGRAVWVVNETRYSATTARHQRDVEERLRNVPRSGEYLRSVNGLPRGATPTDVLNAHHLSKLPETGVALEWRAGKGPGKSVMAAHMLGLLPEGDV